MNNTATNNIKYTGIVTLSQYVQNKKIELTKVHNAGTDVLFNFLADCLLGDFDIAKVNRPTKILLLKEVVDANKGTTTYVDTSGWVFLRSKPEKIYSVNMSKVRYSFIVDRAMLTQDFTHVGLYTNSAQNSNSFAAIADLQEYLKLNNIDNSAAILIDWELIISNNSQEAE